MNARPRGEEYKGFRQAEAAEQARLEALEREATAKRAAEKAAAERAAAERAAMSRVLLTFGDGRVGDHYAALAFVATGVVAFSC